MFPCRTPLEVVFSFVVLYLLQGVKGGEYTVNYRCHVCSTHEDYHACAAGDSPGFTSCFDGSIYCATILTPSAKRHPESDNDYYIYQVSYPHEIQWRPSWKLSRECGGTTPAIVDDDILWKSKEPGTKVICHQHEKGVNGTSIRCICHHKSCPKYSVEDIFKMPILMAVSDPLALPDTTLDYSDPDACVCPDCLPMTARHRSSLRHYQRHQEPEDYEHNHDEQEASFDHVRASSLYSPHTQ